MQTIVEQIEEIEEVLRKTPHHKATDHFIGRMRAKISKLRDKETDQSSKGGGGGLGYAVKKHGDASIALVGPPSAGKSTLINKLTNANSKTAEYAFTTVSVIPGMMKYRGADIQILDIPGLITGASLGKGRGREVLSVARNADLLVIMTDTKRINLLDQIAKELEGAGVRINKQAANIKIEKKVSGGLNAVSNIKQDFSLQTVKDIASEMGFKNGDISLKEKVSIDELVDSFSKRIVYKPAIFVVNKIDLKSKQKNDNYLYISAEKDINLDLFREIVWNNLGLVKIYLVKKDQKPGKNNPIIMKSENTLQDIANSIGTEFAEGKKLAKVWGTGSKFPGQELPLSTKVIEGMQVRFV